MVLNKFVSNRFAWYMTEFKAQQVQKWCQTLVQDISLTKTWQSSFPSIGSDRTFFIEPIDTFSVRSVNTKEPITWDWLLAFGFRAYSRHSTFDGPQINQIRASLGKLIMRLKGLFKLKFLKNHQRDPKRTSSPNHSGLKFEEIKTFTSTDESKQIPRNGSPVSLYLSSYPAFSVITAGTKQVIPKSRQYRVYTVSK